MSDRVKLIRMPSGDWVRPDTVTTIKTFGPSVIHGHKILTRVVVVAGGTHHEISFPGTDEARAFADDLAAKVNNA